MAASVSSVYLEDERWGPALSRPPGLLDPAVLNTRRWRSTSFGAIGLHASARALAHFYDDVLRPQGQVAGPLGADLQREYVGAQASGRDRVIGGMSPGHSASRWDCCTHRCHL